MSSAKKSNTKGSNKKSVNQDDALLDDNINNNQQNEFNEQELNEKAQQSGKKNSTKKDQSKLSISKQTSILEERVSEKKQNQNNQLEDENNDQNPDQLNQVNKRGTRSRSVNKKNQDDNKSARKGKQQSTESNEIEQQITISQNQPVRTTRSRFKQEEKFLGVKSGFQQIELPVKKQTLRRGASKNTDQSDEVKNSLDNDLLTENSEENDNDKQTKSNKKKQPTSTKKKGSSLRKGQKNDQEIENIDQIVLNMNDNQFSQLQNDQNVTRQISQLSKQNTSDLDHFQIKEQQVEIQVEKQQQKSSGKKHKNSLEQTPKTPKNSNQQIEVELQDQNQDKLNDYYNDSTLNYTPQNKKSLDRLQKNQVQSQQKNSMQKSIQSENLTSNDKHKHSLSKIIEIEDEQQNSPQKKYKSNNQTPNDNKKSSFSKQMDIEDNNEQDQKEYSLQKQKLQQNQTPNDKNSNNFIEFSNQNQSNQKLQLSQSPLKKNKSSNLTPNDKLKLNLNSQLIEIDEPADKLQKESTNKSQNESPLKQQNESLNKQKNESINKQYNQSSEKTKQISPVKQNSQQKQIHNENNFNSMDDYIGFENQKDQNKNKINQEQLQKQQKLNQQQKSLKQKQKFDNNNENNNNHKKVKKQEKQQIQELDVKKLLEQENQKNSKVVENKKLSKEQQKINEFYNKILQNKLENKIEIEQNDEDTENPFSSYKKNNLQNQQFELDNSDESEQEQQENFQISNKKKQLKQILKNQQKSQKWQDEQDDAIEVDISKVAKLRKLRKNDEETTITAQDYQDRLQSFYKEKLNKTDFFGWGENNEDANDIFNNSNSELNNLLQKESFYNNKTNYRNSSLQSQYLSLSRLGQVLQKDRHQAVIQCLDFYKNSELFLSASLDKLIKIFAINENDNDVKGRVKLQKQVYLEGMPIQQAKFLNQQNQILVSGMKKYLVSYDLAHEKMEKFSSHLFTQHFNNKHLGKFTLSPQEDQFTLCNENGMILLFDAKSKQYQYKLQMNNGYCTDASFSKCSRYLYTTGSDGKIFVWDLSMRRAVSCLNDIGSSNTKCLDQKNNYLAAGSDQGHVNIYDIQQNSLVNSKNQNNKFKFLKEIQNLTTSITGVQFNENCEILAIYSKWKKNALRFVHIPSFTVFENFPKLKTNLSFINQVQFSPNNKYILIGNDVGSTQLYNFHHYN